MPQIHRFNQIFQLPKAVEKLKICEIVIIYRQKQLLKICESVALMG
jgi:hypothetical protein